MREITLDEMKNRYNANKINALVGQVVNIVSFIEYTDRDKNGKEYNQYLFALDNGNLYRTGSIAFYKSFVRLHGLCQMINRDTVTGTVVERPTSNGYTVIVIE